MPMSRQLAAIMFTDIKGYTALMQQNEEQALRVRSKHRRIFNAITKKHRGKILQYYGDGTLSIFSSAIDAVNCGIELQQGFLEAPTIPVRIGIHTGDIIFNEEEIIGDSVNVASRIESLAVPGSVFISDKVYDEIKNQEFIQATRLKTFRLKNIEKPIEVYAIANEGLVIPDVEEIKGKTEPEPDKEKQEAPNSNTPLASFQNSILATKLYIPPIPPNTIYRDRLIGRLQAGIHGKLSLISASAGFGKSTLVSHWVATSGQNVAWLSLDRGDNDTTRFLSYVIAALQTIFEHIGKDILPLLQFQQMPPFESLLTSLLNEVSSLEKPFILVLDDYHLIDNHAIDKALIFLIERMPLQMHMVIATREDPNIPLSRLRIRGQMTELRAQDLRFSSAEAAEFLNQTMDLKLSSENVEALEIRTEGWIAGLQMAALSMQGRPDKDHFIKAFRGSHHFVLDYLMEEVLQQQSEPVRDFLLQTAILERLNHSLCNALTGQDNGNEMLEMLEKANLFVIPLDNQREWYRFHHLFADVLRSFSLKNKKYDASDLHRRASHWFEKEGLALEAMQHALNGKDLTSLARLIELNWETLRKDHHDSTLSEWLKALPDDLIQFRPILNVYSAFAILSIDLQAADNYLKQAEALLDPESSIYSKKIIVNQKEFASIPGMISIARSYYYGALGDISAITRYAQIALEQLPEDNYLWRGSAAALLGLAQWPEGKLFEAQRSFASSVESMRKAGDISAVVSAGFLLADIKMAQGLLHGAQKTCRQLLKQARQQPNLVYEGMEGVYVLWGETCFEQGEIEEAKGLLEEAKNLGPFAALSETKYRWPLLMARIKQAEGKLDAAFEFFEEAEQQYTINPTPETRPISAWKTRLFLVQGQLREAEDWVRNQNLSINDDLSYLREFEHITLVRVLIAKSKNSREDQYLKEAKSLLGRLLAAAEKGKRWGSVVEILILLTIIYDLLGDRPSAIASLHRAFMQAKPEEYFQIFLNEEIQLLPLLGDKSLREMAADIVQQLPETEQVNDSTPQQPFLMRPSQTVRPLLESLSRRELEVLRLIAKGLSNREISERLFLALSTVKGHNQKIFDKLEVQRRTEAVARARELGLI